MNLAMLTALGKPAELKLHVKGALNNGLTPDEIRRALIHAAVYYGIPAGLEAFKAAQVRVAEGAAEEMTKAADVRRCEAAARLISGAVENTPFLHSRTSRRSPARTSGSSSRICNSPLPSRNAARRTG